MPECGLEREIKTWISGGNESYLTFKRTLVLRDELPGCKDNCFLQISLQLHHQSPCGFMHMRSGLTIAVFQVHADQLKICG